MPPVDPYQLRSVGVAFVVAVAVFLALYLLAPNAPTTAVVGAIATGSFLVGLGNFLWARPSLRITGQGHVRRDKRYVLIVAQATGSRPIVIQQVQARGKKGQLVDVPADFDLGMTAGYADRLEHDRRRGCGSAGKF